MRHQQPGGIIAAAAAGNRSSAGRPTGHARSTRRAGFRSRCRRTQGPVRPTPLWRGPPYRGRISVRVAGHARRPTQPALPTTAPGRWEGSRRAAASCRQERQVAVTNRDRRVAKCLGHVPGTRSGRSPQICSTVIPSATMSTTVATGMRNPRMVGTPAITSGSTVIRLNSMPSWYAVARFWSRPRPTGLRTPTRTPTGGNPGSFAGTRRPPIRAQRDLRRPPRDRLNGPGWLGVRVPPGAQRGWSRRRSFARGIRIACADAYTQPRTSCHRATGGRSRSQRPTRRALAGPVAAATGLATPGFHAAAKVRRSSLYWRL